MKKVSSLICAFAIFGLLAMAGPARAQVIVAPGFGQPFVFASPSFAFVQPAFVGGGFVDSGFVNSGFAFASRRNFAAVGLNGVSGNNVTLIENRGLFGRRQRITNINGNGNVSVIDRRR